MASMPSTVCGPSGDCKRFFHNPFTTWVLAGQVARPGPAFHLLSRRTGFYHATVREHAMAGKTAAGTGVQEQTSPNGAPTVTRDKLVQLLNDDLAREYQAVIAYVVYSQVL